MVRQCRLGAEAFVLVWHGVVRQVSRREAGFVPVRCGRSVQARFDGVWCGAVRQVWQGAVLCGTEWLGNAGKQLGEKHE